METRELKKIDDVARAAMREHMEEVLKRVQTSVNEQTQEAMKGVTNTLKRLQTIMDQQSAAITELKSNQLYLDSGSASITGMTRLGKYSAQHKGNAEMTTAFATEYPIQLKTRQN